MFSRFFIDRPIFATVLAILMILIGIVTVSTLPIAQYPNISPPTVQVSASYPGANAKTVAEAIGVPIEQCVNGVEGMLYMSSNSGSDGSYNLTITFRNGIDLDDATVKVQNLVNRATPRLPSAVTEHGISVNSESTNILLFVALESDDPQRYDALYLTNYAQLHMVDALSRLEGVGGASAFGAGDYSMRIWMNPELMNIRGVTPADIRAAIEAQNMEVSAGAVGGAPVSTPASFQITLSSPGRLVTAQQFGEIVLRTDTKGNILRLKDVAKVELGSESYGNISRVSGKEAGLIGIYQRSDANALSVAKEVEKELENLAPYLPPGVHYRILHCFNRRSSCDFCRDHLYRHACDSAVPPKLESGNHTNDNHSRIINRHIRSNEANGVHPQHSHVVRPRTGHCNCSRRCDCGGGRLCANRRRREDVATTGGSKSHD